MIRIEGRVSRKRGESGMVVFKDTQIHQHL
jgi:hypothetical protein